MRAWEAIEVGALIHNDTPAFRVDLMPYGGVRDSGLGREGPRYRIAPLKVKVAGGLTTVSVFEPLEERFQPVDGSWDLALWQRRINPWTPTGEIKDQDLEALFEAARGAMRSNLKPTTEPTGRRDFPGYGRGAVHGRGGRPCRRCGSRIKVKAQGEHARLTYWCPACQPGPER